MVNMVPGMARLGGARMVSMSCTDVLEVGLRIYECCSSGRAAY
jgi:hypothetical protein